MDVQALDSKGSAHDGTHECEFDKQNYVDAIFNPIFLARSPLSKEELKTLW